MAQQIRRIACCMTVKAIMPVRINLVVPLACKATAMRITDTAGTVPGRVRRSFLADRSEPSEGRHE